MINISAKLPSNFKSWMDYNQATEDEASLNMDKNQFSLGSTHPPACLPLKLISKLF
jgi:hypothetical protein